MLSACNTGAGGVRPSGLSRLARAFILAQARALLSRTGKLTGSDRQTHYRRHKPARCRQVHGPRRSNEAIHARPYRSWQGRGGASGDLGTVCGCGRRRSRKRVSVGCSIHRDRGRRCGTSTHVSRICSGNSPSVLPSDVIAMSMSFLQSCTGAWQTAPYPEASLKIR